jgi:hypothetical protein
MAVMFLSCILKCRTKLTSVEPELSEGGFLTFIGFLNNSGMHGNCLKVMCSANSCLQIGITLFLCASNIQCSKPEILKLWGAPSGGRLWESELFV